MKYPKFDKRQERQMIKQIEKQEREKVVKDASPYFDVVEQLSKSTKKLETLLKEQKK